MARTNVTIPDDILRRAREAGLNVSGLAAAALAEELDRRKKIAALDAHLAQLEAELGPVSAQETASAEAWADDLERQLAGAHARSEVRRAG